MGLLRVERFSEEKELGSALVTRDERQEVARREFGDEAQARERKAKARVVARVHQVAMKQERRADADCRTVHRGDEELRGLARRLEEMEHGGIGALGRALHEILEVVPRVKTVGWP